MNAMTGRGFGLVASQEELLLRRRLLFRLLKQFDFEAPVDLGEMITAPALPEQHGKDWPAR